MRFGDGERGFGMTAERGVLRSVGGVFAGSDVGEPRSGCLSSTAMTRREWSQLGAITVNRTESANASDRAMTNAVPGLTPTTRAVVP